MPDTTIVVACAVVALLLVVVLVLRSRGKASADAQAEPRFEPPREIAKRPPKEAKPAEAAPDSEVASADGAPAEVVEAKAEAPAPTLEPGKAEVPSAFPPPEPPKPTEPPKADVEEDEKTQLDTRKHVPPVKGEAPVEETPDGSKAGQRMPFRSYSSISDQSAKEKDEKKADDAAAESATQARKDDRREEEEKKETAASEPDLINARAEAKLLTSESRIPPPPTPERKLTPPPQRSPVGMPSEPKIAATAKPLEARVSEPKVPAKRPIPLPSRRGSDEHDFSALNEAAKAAQAAAPVVPAPVVPAPAPATPASAKYAPPSNPATADLEKNDPRHAAARRLARVSVSEIKLYHEDEVKAGREANDLWKRLGQDIHLAMQTFEARVVPEVRDRFDYLYDEILRQLAEGDPKKLGPDAPPGKGTAAPSDEAVTPIAPVVVTPIAPAVVPPAAIPTPAKAVAPEPAPAKPAAEVVEEPPLLKALEGEAPKPAPAPAKPAAPTAEAGKPSGLASRVVLAPNPETAELEKSDPRHAAARRLARLSVSEIKLYHEDEVRAGREAKDLWKRLGADIGLAIQTFDKRVVQEVRDRYDYLYDEILRQLAEGDVAKLGPDAPPPPKTRLAGLSSAEPAKAVPAPPPTPAPAPKAEAPSAEPPKPEPPKPEPPKAAAPATGAAAIAGRYAPPTNPATAELEKNDPRHAAARRLARLSVSEIKLYHEDEVKAGREAKDLWKRLTTDIGLALQTYEKRVDKEVRERFDYLYDEILRQLAEGDVAKLGPEAPKPKED